MTRHTRLLLCAVLLLTLTAPCLAAKWYKVLDLQGKGNKTTKWFSVQGAWCVEYKTWTNTGYDGTFAAWLYDETKHMVALIGNVSGYYRNVTYPKSWGWHYLDLDSTQSWHVIVWDHY